MSATITNPMQTAWANYRLARPAFFAAGDESGHRCFLPDLFRRLLRGAWDEMRQQQRWALSEAANEAAARLVLSIRRVQQDLIDRMTPEAREQRIRAVLDEIALLPYAPLGIHIRQREADLRDELEMLMPKAGEPEAAPVTNRHVGLVAVAAALSGVAA